MSSAPPYRVVRAEPVEVAPGFSVHRAMPLRGFRGQDPFLLLDHFGPITQDLEDFHPVPPHPHRGFVAVTYLLEGRIRHRDSIGNDIVVDAGDLNWISAAYGLQHSEHPSPIAKNGKGTLHGIQLWVNLPARHKLDEPVIQHLASAKIPEVEHEGVRLRVLAGSYEGHKSVIHTVSPVDVAHVIIDPSTSFEYVCADECVASVYVLEGSCSVGEPATTVFEHEIACMAENVHTISFNNTSDTPCSMLILSGKPLNEPVFAHGPFVMNSFEEIQTAIHDFQRGEMGLLDY